MPDAIITSTESTFGTISGTFAADQSTITGTVTGIVAGTLDGTVGVPGPGVPLGGTEGQIIVKQSSTDYDTAWADNSAETLTATVRNETGATLTKGTVVYITGAAGNKALVSKASASSEATSSKTFAILSANIPNNQNGTAVTVGLLKGLDTSALTEGGSLWLSTTAGQWTQTMPTAPNHAVFLGTVTRVHANQGTVEVRIQNGYELQELHNVKITSVSNGQVLKYDSAQSLWVNGTDVGVPAGGTAGQFLQKIDGTDYNTDWVTVNLSAYAVKANNLSDLTSFSDARDNLGLGTLNTPTFAGVTAQGSGSNVANLTPTSLSLTHATSGSFTIQPSVGITFPDSTVQTTAFTGSVATTWGSITGTLSSQTDLQTALDGKYSTSNPAGYITSSALTGYATESWVTAGFYPLTGNPSGFLTSASLTGYATQSWVTSQGYITSAALSPYLLSSTAASTYQTIAGMSSYLTTSAAASTYYPLTNPSGYITSSALSPYLTSATAASTYQTLSGMSSYLTTATAASTYATILEPSVDGILTVEPSGSNSATVQVNQDANNYIHLRAGVGQIAIVYGGSTKWFFNDTYLQFPGGTQQTVAYPGPSGFLLKADNLSGLANTGTARTNLGLGTMATETASNYLTTATASTTYAPLASPTFTGTPTLPTGTIAVTQSAGNNTTAVATTAFVQQEVPAASTTAAGKVELATDAEVITGTSTTLALVPGHAGFLKADPRLRSLAHINSTQVVGSGAITANTGSLYAREMYLSSLATGRANFTYGTINSTGACFLTSKADRTKIDFSKKIWVAGTACCAMTLGATNYSGDANTNCRIVLAGYSFAQAGDMNQKGIGWKKAGGTSSFVNLTVHNGTTLTNVATTFAPGSGQVFDWLIYSDGSGNVTLYIDGAQVATTSAGPTGTTTAGYNAYVEQVDAPTTPSVRQIMHCNGGYVYFAD